MSVDSDVCVSSSVPSLPLVDADVQESMLSSCEGNLLDGLSMSADSLSDDMEEETKQDSPTSMSSCSCSPGELQNKNMVANKLSAQSATQNASSVPKQQFPRLHEIGNLVQNKIAELESSQEKEYVEERIVVRACKLHMTELKRQLDAIEAPEEKFRWLHSSYLPLLHECKCKERELNRLKHTHELTLREKDDKLQKASLLKDKLETLCRELQRQNKLVMEDSRRVANEEQQKRTELSQKFQLSIKNITTKLERHQDERMKVLKEDEDLKDKLKCLAEQYEIREQHFASQMKAKGLELQLAEAKLEQQTEVAMQEHVKAQTYLSQLDEVNKNERSLREQLGTYRKKFQHFHVTITQSNELFAGFKKEMDKMSGTIKKLEKDNAALRKKTEKSDVSLITLAEERTLLRHQAESLKAQKKKLEDLCRALQSDRASLSAKLKSRDVKESPDNGTESQIQTDLTHSKVKEHNSSTGRLPSEVTVTDVETTVSQRTAEGASDDSCSKSFVSSETQ